MIRAASPVCACVLVVVLGGAGVVGGAEQGIEAWKRKFVRPRAFTWLGANYLLVLPASLNFLVRVPPPPRRRSPVHGVTGQGGAPAAGAGLSFGAEPIPGCGGGAPNT